MDGFNVSEIVQSSEIKLEWWNGGKDFRTVLIPTNPLFHHSNCEGSELSSYESPPSPCPSPQILGETVGVGVLDAPGDFYVLLWPARHGDWLTRGETMDNKYKALIERSIELGASEAKLINVDQIVFDPRSHLKCRFGCNRWGRFWTCPPHLTLSNEMFMDAFRRYDKAIIIKTQEPKAGQEISVAIEKEAMLSNGCGFAFAMALCVQCEPCAYPEPCRYPHLARPAMDAYGIDIGKTIESLGLKVEFDKEGRLLPAWYCMVLVD